MSAIIPFVPMIQDRANQVKGNLQTGARYGFRYGIPVIIGGIVVGWLWVRSKQKRAEAVVAKIGSDANARAAALYVEALKPAGFWMKLISLAVPLVGVADTVVGTVQNWMGIGDTDKVLAITKQLTDWEQTVIYYRDLTGGRSLNKDIKAKLGGDYQKFVDTLSKNTTAVDIKRREQMSETANQAASDALRTKIMAWEPGKIKEVAKDSAIRRQMLASKVASVVLYQEPGHKKVARVKEAHHYVGKPSGRFLNYQGTNAMVELVTSNGLIWAEWNDLETWRAK